MVVVVDVQAKLRMNGDKPFVTDNSNYIVDLYFKVAASPSPSLLQSVASLLWVIVEYGLSV